MKPATVIASLLAALFLAVQPAGAGDRKLTVVELFTSQGCNSCPPADRLMGDLAKRDDVLGLSFHVDYWDYIGWRDTFALPESGIRQRNYVTRANGRYAYTPQIVVDGTRHVVGSHGGKVMEAIETAGAGPGVAIGVQDDGDGQFRVRLPAQDMPGTAWVWLVTFDDSHRVDIRRGENAGKSLSYHNVVRKIERIAVWKGDTALSIPVDMRQAWADGRDGCAIIVQSEGFGPILGAARIANSKS